MVYDVRDFFEVDKRDINRTSLTISIELWSIAINASVVDDSQTVLVDKRFEWRHKSVFNYTLENFGKSWRKRDWSKIILHKSG